MSKEIYISSTPQETRLAIVENTELTEIYYERENEYTLAGSIYNGKVTRVLPGMQSSFVDIGLERDAFLYITDFMEEAGDSADFEGGGEGKSGSGGGGRRDGRGGGSGSGGSGGRGRRERGSQSTGGDGSGDAEVRTEDGSAEGAAERRPAAGDGDEIGEGAPGADGSRRWRGRRGRRRGRPEGAPAEAGGSTEPSTVIESDGFDEDAPAASESSAREAAPREGAREGGREERGGRRRRGEGREDRGPRESRGGSDDGGRRDQIRERFAPRGPRTSHGSEETVDLEGSAASQSEPFVLPGESLSKYRRGEGGDAERVASAKSEPVAAAAASTEYTVQGWDGGLVLPGETIRPRGGASDSRGHDSRGEERQGSREGRREERGGQERGGQERGGRGEAGGNDRRRGRDGRRGRGLDPAIAVQPAVTSGHDVEPTALPFVDDSAMVEADTERMGEEAVHSQDAAHAEFVAQRLEVQEELDAVDPVIEPETAVVEAHTEETAAAAEAVEEFHETVAEYEPEENASASYRVDTGETRELRRGSAVGNDAPVDNAAGDAFLREEAEGDRMAAEDHAFTSVQATGEMISEPFVEEEELEDETSPMEHERAVQGVHLDESEGTPVLSKEQASQTFAPGDGELEEELLDEEDEGGLALLASSAFDEDTEEEVLEGTADLGTMIADMSLDALVHPDSDELGEDAEFDDEDMEDEDLEEDELGSDEELGSGNENDETFADDESTEGFEEEGTEGGEGEGKPSTERSGESRERTGRRDRPRGRDRGGRERSGGERNGGERSGGERSGSERSGSDRGSRDRRGSSGGRSGGRMSRSSAQLTDLPAISDLLKPGQEVLVQIAKEPMAKKGARITSHIALPGRFLVFMPTVSHIGVSRKIESDGERRRLKEILLSERGEASGGFIVRTAAAGASEEELRSDLRFLLNLWTDIKQRSESSKSPALIYHDLNLIERILRDQVTDNFSAIWVDTEAEYERVLRFLQRFQPNLIRRVKLYTKDTPLFEQFGLTEEINKALRSKVWLKSGGSIVINQTEALVAIDINTGKFVGKTARLEDTIVKTNLDSIPEIVRQIRLRDLGGIIVIDFIDMDERKNRNKVLMALEDELKKDRAPSKVLQFNDFGLVAITRKRVKQSLERTLSTTCNICAGTGMVKSPVTVCNDIYVELRKMHKHFEKGDVMLRVNPEVTKQLKLNGGKWLQEMEEMSGKTILVKSDPSLHPEQFDLH